MEKLVLIDGHSILNRAFYGVPDLTNQEGLHTNAVYGFLNIMFKILEEEKANYLAVAFDLKAPTFRHIKYAEYKGTRKPMPEELRQQVPLIKEVLTAMQIPIMCLEGYEADDILGTVGKEAAHNGYEVSIISGDRDLLQLSEEHIKIRIPKTSKGSTIIKDYYPKDVEAEYLVTPTAFIDVKALMGDASDNIPGVPSIGEKTATALIQSYQTIENAFAHVDEIKPPRAQKALREHYDLAVLSKDLATICTTAPFTLSMDDAKIENLYTPEAYDYIKRLEFKSLLKRFENDQNAETNTIKQLIKTVSDFTEIEEILQRASQAKELGLSLLQEKGRLYGFSISFEDDFIYVITLGGFITEAYLKESLRMLCTGNSIVGIFHLKDYLPILNLDYNEQTRDISIGAYLLYPMKDTYEYDDIARDYLDLTLPQRKELLGKHTLLQAYSDDTLKNLAFESIGYEAYVAKKALSVLENSLSSEEMLSLYLDIEMPLIYSLYHMEQEGIRINREELHQYGSELMVKIKQLETEILEEAQVEFNINSPKQLGEVLFDTLKLPHGKKTKTGYSTSADVLEKLAPEYPVVRNVLEYRQLSKLNSTYAQGLANYIEEDGRIHGTFNQTITATGRISSTEPNLQNIPIRMELGRAIRKVFVPKDGCVFIDADYSQIELRILSHMSSDERLISAYRNAQDIHTITASEVFHTPLEEVTPLQRRNAKAVNFGIVYGISAFGLSEDLSISRKEANEYIEKYFETYPQVKQFLDQLVAQGKEQGYVSSMFHRKRPIPELSSSNFMQRSFGERVAMNSPIQGTAADIMKIAMISVDKELRKRKLKSRIVLQVHDELLIEAPIEEQEEVTLLLVEKMKHAANLSVALEVEAHIGVNWLDAK